MIRVDVSGCEFVNYEYDSSKEGYAIYNPENVNLSRFSLPKNIEEAEEILGKKISRNINFNDKAEEIFLSSKVKEFQTSLAEL